MQRRVNIWAAVDKITLMLFLILVVMGWLNIYAAVYNEDHRSIFDFSQRYGKQLVWIVTTLILASAVLFIDSRFYFFFSYFIYGLFLFMLLLVLVLGKEINGARAWFELGPLSLQPSEFAKAGTALALAKYLNSKGQELTRLRLLIPAVFIIMAPAVLTFMQPDMGTTVVYFSFFIVLFREGLSPYLFASGFLLIILFFSALLFDELWIYSVILLTGVASAYFFVKSRNIWVKGILLLALFAGAIYLANYFFLHTLSTGGVLIIALILAGLSYIWYIYRYREKKILVIYLFVLGSMLYVNLVDYAFNHFLKPHQKERIEILLRVKDDPKGAGYNINQSVISIGSGGFTGKGYLRGTQTKFRFVPAQSTDFIFCTIGEEWGFAGSFVVIGLYVFLLLRLIFLAERQRSSFSRIYGYGVVSVLLIHFFINIGMASGIVPVIGIPLPFIIYGGSSLWGFTLLLFIFLRLDAARTEYLV